jgi:hypothetical protein
MKNLCTILLLLCCGLAASWAQTAAPPATLRLDYFHTGNAAQEMFSFDGYVREPLPWPGNPKRPIDDTNLGKYLFEVRDRASNRLLYSRGFASVYGEWETTDEAKTLNRTFSESLRFPEPQAPAQILLKKRDAANNFREVWSVMFDPRDIFIDTSKPASPGPLISIEKNGEPADKLDFLILGDGYTAAERGKCEKDARRLTGLLFATAPFQQRRHDFNVWALCPAAAESGISRPSSGIHKRPPAGSTYDAFGSERYILTFDNKAFRDLASYAPYEFVEILVNGETYGGGGIFGLYSTVAADSYWAPYVFVHEFGHHLAGLADEYFTSDVAYLPPEKKIEPWEPNITALLDPPLLKWKDLVSPGTPLPTPWNEDAFVAYERQVQAKRRELRKQNRPETEINALFEAEKKHEEQMFAAEPYAGKVGAFEGANYEAKGYYRPQINCIMFTRANEFCRVCQRGIEKVIDLYSR